METLIEIHDLAKVYERGKQKVEVLHHVDLAIAQGPCIAAGLRIAMYLPQVVEPMADGDEVLLAQVGVIGELAGGHGVVEDEARAADEVAMAAVVDRAVVLEVVEEAAVRIDAARVVERHRVGDVRAQEGRRAEIWQLVRRHPGSAP